MFAHCHTVHSEWLCSVKSFFNIVKMAVIFLFLQFFFFVFPFPAFPSYSSPFKTRVQQTLTLKVQLHSSEKKP